jgi:predicted nucleic acid-binding Zn finger protein
LKDLVKKINNTIDFITKYVKFTRKDIYFGIIILIIANFLNNIINNLNGYLTIEIPQSSSNKNAFYYKKMLDGKKIILYLKQNDINKELNRELFYVIKKNDKILDEGYCTIPLNYYSPKLTLSIIKNNFNCLIKKDYLSEQFEKKQLKLLENYAKTYKHNE